ncbi:sigma-70 family RNA polymerase sigma factor [Rhizobiaceae bacterium BDR2-2]|uniref:Sigma-70 family RNA polymerase sigma factor n=1 Tax=Ectorhizobium quercum TaxID=2965071 RepID=A0AAE3SWD7_9HYPH|nr:sigma-70 family RNA polymerase sigma factor [Ectorhizobium quercum]MCX8997914.1 sigma-70 family RNA polymerase sigma factor [Ectorhizobium quercum]
MDTDASRLDLVFLQMQKMLFRSVLRIVRDAPVAEELTQEVYLRARKAVETTVPTHMEAFLWRTARNLAFDHIRQNKVRSAFEPADFPGEATMNIADGKPSAEEQVIQKDDLRVFGEALSKLPPRTQQAWLLSRVEGWPYPKIAAHLGVSPNTVFNDIKMVMGLLFDLRARLDRQ